MPFLPLMARIMLREGKPKTNAVAICNLKMIVTFAGGPLLDWVTVAYGGVGNAKVGECAKINIKSWGSE